MKNEFGNTSCLYVAFLFWGAVVYEHSILSLPIFLKIVGVGHKVLLWKAMISCL